MKMFGSITSTCTMHIFFDDLTSLIDWRMVDGFSFGSRNCPDVAVSPISSAVCSRVCWQMVIFRCCQTLHTTKGPSTASITTIIFYRRFYMWMIVHWSCSHHFAALVVKQILTLIVSSSFSETCGLWTSTKSDASWRPNKKPSQVAHTWKKM